MSSAAEVLSAYRRLLKAIGNRPGGIGYGQVQVYKKFARTLFELGRDEPSASKVNEMLDTVRYTTEQLEQGLIPEGARMV